MSFKFMMIFRSDPDDVTMVVVVCGVVSVSGVVVVSVSGSQVVDDVLSVSGGLVVEESVVIACCRSGNMNISE